MSEASNRQVDIQNKIEQRYRDALNKILTPIVGPGNFTAEVHADVDFTETQATRESFPKDTAVVRTEQGGWTGDKNGGEASGIPGARLSNQPPGRQPGDRRRPAADRARTRHDCRGRRRQDLGAV